jgi:C4-dicarboxylate transporter, DctM subunit
MRRHGYSKKVAYAICASAGAIGMFIPPSILAIVYGMLSGVSVGKVLMAGICPGILWSLGFIGVILLHGKRHPEDIPLPKLREVTWEARIKSLKLWWPILVVSITVFGGIYGGVFTPSEGAAVAAFVLFVVYFLSNFVSRSKSFRAEKWKDLNDILKDTATTSGMIFLIMGASNVFSNFLVLTGVTTKVNTLITELGLSQLNLVILISIIYLILGCFLEGISMLCITIPIFNPVIAAAGIDPIWYATIVITSVEMGLITPPVGMNLYATYGVAEADVKLEDVLSGITPYFFAEVVCLIILFSFPQITTFLPSFIG